jgi:hypothetical protein
VAAIIGNHVATLLHGGDSGSTDPARLSCFAARSALAGAYAKAA